MTAAPLTYTVSASADADGGMLLAAGDDLALETRWQPDAPSTHPGPAELLAGAFAACLLKNVARSGAMLPFAYESVRVEVTMHRQDAPPRFTAIEYTLHLVTTEPAHRIELLHRNLQKFGTVYNTLAAVCEVSGTVTTTPPAG
ncbi:OsmC family protein [Microcella sp.]|uniref:OsmC family protein n=1 Tax=Microcella sp. TaxID=1913979 RepID=UPI00391C3AD2